MTQSSSRHLTSKAGTRPLRIAFIMAELGTGGIARVRVNLTRELVERGIDVDLVMGRARGPFLAQLDARVRVHVLGSSHALLGLPRLAAYLWRRSPDVVVCEKLRVNLAAHRACALVRQSAPIFAEIHGVLSHKLEGENLRDRKKHSKYRDIAKAYPRNAGFLPVSTGIADDLVAGFGVPREKVHVVHNPVVTDRMMAMALETVDHPWLVDKELPVVVGVGRLEQQKDFATLIQAFARLQGQTPCRLLILGEGSERAQLQAMIDAQGLTSCVDLHGFVGNPYAYVARSDVFVLSSKWEGFGNVIVEAMAMGVPVVSTDCPAGPHEILDGGRHGCLVPIGDVEAMAEAIDATLRSEPDRSALIAEAMKYTPSACANDYLVAFGLGDSGWMRP